MNQFYLNGPSKGCAMSAEEFAARVCRRSGAQPGPASDGGCGCGTMTAPSAECPGQCPSRDECSQAGEYGLICCCRPVSGPAPQPPQVEEGCCCKQSFRAALGLLCGQQLSGLLDFDAAAFLTSTYAAGAALSCQTHSGHGPCAEAGPEAEGRRRPPCQSCSGGAWDNLGTLSGSFRRFAPCTCDLLDVDAPVYAAGGGASLFTATQISLCQLDAVAIQAAAACAEGDLTAEEATARNFRCLRARLAQQLDPCGGCGQEQCACACDGRDCCCAAGLLAALAQNNLSRRVSLVAGLLVLNGATLLGTVGNVLVLSNDTDNRLYLVCVNSVQFIG